MAAKTALHIELAFLLIAKIRSSHGYQRQVKFPTSSLDLPNPPKNPFHIVGRKTPWGEVLTRFSADSVFAPANLDDPSIQSLQREIWWEGPRHLPAESLTNGRLWTKRRIIIE
jgi:hypothetical protein